jgi:hypothetical protein
MLRSRVSRLLVTAIFTVVGCGDFDQAAPDAAPSSVDSQGAALDAVPIPPASGTAIPPDPSPNVLQAGQRLDPNQQLGSSDARYSLKYQTDGNLVLYRGTTMMWSSHAVSSPGYARMETTGNLVLRDAGGTPRWNSRTSGHPNSYLVLRDNGRAEITTPTNQVIWVSGDPECSTGVSRDAVCCAASCGICGGTGCGGRPGGTDACCMGWITDVNQSCGDHQPPCVMP